MSSAAKPILVTGAHRSGTTWVGRMLAHASNLCYIHEPFNVSDPPGPGICNARFQHWFTQIDQTNEGRYYRALRDTIELKYALGAALRTVRCGDDLRRIGTEYRYFLQHRLRGSRPLLKDPLALLSAEWLAARFGVTVAIVIRHPAAFVSSIKRLNWSHPFRHFLEQERLMSSTLQTFHPQIEQYAKKEHDVVDQAILLWRILHHVIADYRRRRQDWIFVRHEDLSANPLEGFRKLYGRLDLQFTSAVAAAIDEYSSISNPSDVAAPVGSESSLKRDSRSNAWNWRERLSSVEITRIRNGLEDVSREFYSDEEWQPAVR